MKAIDLFAGWGGFTEGATRAGIDIVWAANHWPLAVEVHAANHPTATHVCQDLRQADWSCLPEYDIMLAAPACQGHSQAAQGARKYNKKARRAHDTLRATAWSVVDCAEVTRPSALIVENVPDFLRWGLYPRWRSCLEDLGYFLTEIKLRASYYGVPQRRDRIFIVGSRKNKMFELDCTDEPAFDPYVEWDEGVWKKVSDATPAVRERVARSRRRLGGARRFLTQHTRDHYGVPLHEPIRTITTKDQWALVDGSLYRPLTVRENARAMGFPDTYVWPDKVCRKDVIRGLGNAVCPPVAQALVTGLVSTL